MRGKNTPSRVGVKRIPALTGEAIDTIGAGVAFFARRPAGQRQSFLAAFIGRRRRRSGSSASATRSPPEI